MGLKFVLHQLCIDSDLEQELAERIASTEKGLKCHLKSAESWSLNEAASVQLLKNDFILAKWHCAFMEGFVECKCVFIGRANSVRDIKTVNQSLNVCLCLLRVGA